MNTPTDVAFANSLDATLVAQWCNQLNLYRRPQQYTIREYRDEIRNMLPLVRGIESNLSTLRYQWEDNEDEIILSIVAYSEIRNLRQKETNVVDFLVDCNGLDCCEVGMSVFYLRPGGVVVRNSFVVEVNPLLPFYYKYPRGAQVVIQNYPENIPDSDGPSIL